MRSIIGAAALLVTLAATAPAQRFGPQPDAKTKSTLLALRESAWRTWFANDKEGFTKVVPEELLAMSWGGGPWEDRTQTIASMEAFAKEGQTLTQLQFPETVFQRYGDVVILYSTYRVELTDKAGKKQNVHGRGTEVFVLRNGRWIHTAWQLDKAS